MPNKAPFNNPKQLKSVPSFARDVDTERVCYDTTSPELFDDFLVYSSVVSVLMFALPFMVVMVCYGLMMRKLLEPGWRSEGGAERERGALSAHRSKQKSVKMIIIVLATFMLCFLPFHLTRSLYYSFRYLRQVNPAQVSTGKYFFKNNKYVIMILKAQCISFIWSSGQLQFAGGLQCGLQGDPNFCQRQQLSGPNPLLPGWAGRPQ